MAMYADTTHARYRIQDPEILEDIAAAQEQCASAGRGAVIFTLKLCENQRKSMWGKWAAENLFPAERGALTHGDGTGSYDFFAAAGQRLAVPSVDPPRGWRWQGEWAVSADNAGAAASSDGERWQYAFAWGMDFGPSSGANKFVRRRVWARAMAMEPAAAKEAARKVRLAGGAEEAAAAAVGGGGGGGGSGGAAASQSLASAAGAHIAAGAAATAHVLGLGKVADGVKANTAGGAVAAPVAGQ
jgi:hypothetical protein